MVIVPDDDIKPFSDLTGKEELYYVLHQYEEMETAVLHFNCNNFESETIWQKSEKEKIDRIDDFIESVLLSQLSVRTHITAPFSGSKLERDGTRYIRVARSELGHTEAQKTFMLPKPELKIIGQSLWPSLKLRFFVLKFGIFPKILYFYENVDFFCKNFDFENYSTESMA